MNKDRVIVALDVDTAKEAFDLVDKLPSVNCFKVGWQLFANEGLSVVQSLSDRDVDVFLDLKINDISNTVEQAVRTLTKIERVKFFTFQGAWTINPCLDGCANDYTKFLCVPILSSQYITEDDFKMTMFKISTVLVDGVIASGQRIKWAKEMPGRSSCIVVAPGIRQHRKREEHLVSCTAQEAFDFGADYIVIGREITQANDPEKALEKML